MTAASRGEHLDGYATNNIAPTRSTHINHSAQDDIAKHSVILPGLAATKNAVRYVLGPAQLTGKSVKSAIASRTRSASGRELHAQPSTGSPLWTRSPRRTSRAASPSNSTAWQSAPLHPALSGELHVLSPSGRDLGSFTEPRRRTSHRHGSSVRFPCARPLTDPDRLADAGSQRTGSLVSARVSWASRLVLLYTILYDRALGLVIVLGLSVTAACSGRSFGARPYRLRPEFDLAGVTG